MKLKNCIQITKMITTIISISRLVQRGWEYFSQNNVGDAHKVASKVSEKGVAKSTIQPEDLTHGITDKTYMSDAIRKLNMNSQNYFTGVSSWAKKAYAEAHDLNKLS